MERPPARDITCSISSFSRTLRTTVLSFVSLKVNFLINVEH